MKPIVLKVKTKDHTYPIIIGKNLIINLSKIFKKNQINFGKCLIVADNKINKNIINKIQNNLNKKKIEVKEIGNPTKIAKSITPTKIKPKIAGSINSAIIYPLLATHPF